MAVRRPKKPCVGREEKKTSESTAATDRFMPILTDDLLFEILLRLTDGRSAVRCSTVSKRWLFLISHPKFAADFIHHHRSRDDSPSPYTLIYLYEDPRFHKDSRFYHFLFNDHPSTAQPQPSSSTSNDYLNFLPWPKESVVIRASFNDLLLVSNARGSSRYYCLCNPTTRQWLALPQAPAKGQMFGLVSEANNCPDPKQIGHGCNCSIRFKVCLIRYSYRHASEDYVFDATIFCSETGRWSQSESILIHPGDRSCYNRRVAVNEGVLYWLLGDPLATGIAAFDPFKAPKQAQTIDMPAELGRGWRSYRECICLGVVCGRLRLSQLYTFKGDIGFSLKVWELLDCDYVSSNSSPWLLVHDLVVKGPTLPKMYVTGFDPNNGDVVFFLQGHDILRCEINAAECECQKVGEYLVDGIRIEQWFRSYFLRTFNIVHPTWPTALPALPSS